MARKPLVLAALLAAGALTAGIGRGGDPCATIPSGAIPQPPGTFLRQWERQQAAAADADAFVIYLHEWCIGGTTLGPYGRYHVQRILERLPTVPFPVVLQPDLNEALNTARRLGVINYLAGHGIADAGERVVVAFPRAEGLFGDAAARVYLGLIGGQGAGGLSASQTGLGLGSGAGLGGTSSGGLGLGGVGLGGGSFGGGSMGY